MKLNNPLELDSSVGFAGATSLQAVGGPICLGIMVVLITH